MNLDVPRECCGLLIVFSCTKFYEVQIPHNGSSECFIVLSVSRKNIIKDIKDFPLVSLPKKFHDSRNPNIDMVLNIHPIRTHDPGCEIIVFGIGFRFFSKSGTSIIVSLA